MQEHSVGSSLAASSTKYHDDSSDEADKGLPNEPTSRSPRTLRGFNPGELTPRDQATLNLLGEKLTEGYSERELANELGVNYSLVSERLRELRVAISLQHGIFPPLTEDEEKSLTESIATYGVIEPVLVDEDLIIISGNNRCRIAKEIGQQDTIRYILMRGLTLEEKEDLAFTLNASRRQLDIVARKKLVEYQLERDAMRSNPLIGAICGVSPNTVQKVRDNLGEQYALLAVDPDDEATELALSEIDQWNLTTDPENVTATIPEPLVKADPPVRLNTAGHVRPAAYHRTVTTPSVSQPAPPLYECPSCGTHLHVFGSPGNYRLELHPAA